MKKRFIIGLFLGLCLMQVIVPISMIIKRENVLKYGEQFKFKTAPVDPYDAFRGRYVALRIETDYVPASEEMKFNNRQTVYALMNTDSQGFTVLTSVVAKRPQAKPYLKTKVRYISGGKVYLDLPINRYYMEEKAAPAAERIYRQHSQTDKQDAYVTARIKDGFAVVEGLYIAGQRIEDLLRQDKKR